MAQATLNIHQLLKQGIRLQNQGRSDEAKAIYFDILKQRPAQSETLHLLGLVFSQEKQWNKAIDYIQRALKEKPEAADFHFNLAQIHHTLHQSTPAIKHYNLALKNHPHPEKIWMKLSRLYFSIQQYNHSIEYCKKVLKSSPDNSDCLHLLAVNYLKVGLSDHSIDIFESLLQTHPDSLEIHNNLGLLYYEKRQFQKAQQSLETAQKIQPDDPENLANLGSIYRALGYTHQAIEYYRQALKLKPDWISLYNNMGLVWQDFGDIEQAKACFKKALELKPDYHQAHSNLICVLRADPLKGVKQVFEEATRWETLHALKPRPLPLKSFNCPLKVGYMSPDFRHHSAAKSFGLLFLNHSSKIQTYLYSDVKSPDTSTENFKNISDHWRSIAGLSDEEVYHLIKGDQLDILVDLTGHSAQNRLKLFSMKPAPILVTGLGYGSTTGLKSIDYFITDPFVVPAQFTPYNSEKIFYISSMIRWIAPELEMELPTEPRSTITFGSGNGLFKLNNDVIACWVNILNKIPEALMIIKTEQFDETSTRENFIKKFTDKKIDPQRLILKGRTSQKEHMEFYNSIDIALEPFPYQGGITTCESLWMGVPTIALKRGTESAVGILAASGFHHWITSSEEEYINKAVEIARNLPEKRISIRQQFENSPICDGKKYAREIENAYEMMVRRYS